MSDDNKATPMMHAAAQGRTEVVKALLEAGADPEAQDITGKTAEGYAGANTETIAALKGESAASSQ
jgi:ankyrin repeat protein